VKDCDGAPELHTMTERGDTKLIRIRVPAVAEQNAELLQVLIRQIGQDAVVYRVLVLLKAEAPRLDRFPLV
jgi:hypothetical protein